VRPSHPRGPTEISSDFNTGERGSWPSARALEQMRTKAAGGEGAIADKLHRPGLGCHTVQSEPHLGARGAETADEPLQSIPPLSPKRRGSFPSLYN
jgi:hypothetical protein